MDLERNNSTGGFDTSRIRRKRKRLLLVAAAILVPVLIYVIATAVSSNASDDPNRSNANSEASNEGGDKPSASAESTESKEKKAQEKRAERDKYKRTAPIPPPKDTCDDLRVLVDHEHSLPPDYAPADLVALESYGIPTLDAGPVLRRKAARQLDRLMDAAAADEEELIIASAFRTYAEQQATFAQFTNVYGDETDTVSAPAGQSQHQLGTAVDFTNSAAEYRLWWPFGDTTGSTWLLENAPDYGFVLAYPDGKEAETGYQWEPWHYRYVGIKNAKRISKENFTLQEFLVREGVLPKC
jgi:D-alanyl-D-alanine carboxypeptidase